MPPFMFFKAIQVVERFDFRIIPIGILDGIYFDRHLPIKIIDNLDEANHDLSLFVGFQKKEL